MAPLTRNQAKVLARSNHSIEKFSDSTKPRCLMARKKGKGLVRCINNGKIDQIPNDILSEGILSKLPLTSLCASKCVSKLWSNLIMQNYYQSQRLPIICRITRSTKPLRLCSVDSNTGAVTPLYSPIDFGPYKLLQTICSNGFFCILDMVDGHRCDVFNPATQESFLVHNPNVYFNHHFGYDPCSNKFKLFGWRRYPYCEVYTLGTDSWRKVNSKPIQGSGKPCQLFIGSLFYCFNGIIYWYSDTGMINLFHLGTESFGTIQGPNSETPIKRVNYMFDLEGCLCLAVLPCKSDKILDLWMLKDQYNVNSGWVLIASVNKPLGKKINWMRPYFIRTGELLLAQCEERGSQSFYLYSLLTRQFHNVKICGQDFCFILNNFKENLASLKDF